MGACFNEMTLDGKLTVSEVRAEFMNEQEIDRYENGHSYSGGFGMADGLSFHEGNGGVPMKSYDEAYQFLCDICEKWKEAITIRYLDDDGNLKWMIGAWCAS